jgi:AraC-like DNA-binding protein
MSENSAAGVLYTDFAGLTAATPGVMALWSFETCLTRRDPATIRRTPDGSHEYWLHRSDPLLNTILPGTGVSLIVNLGDPWAAGRSLTTAALLPRACVVGSVTQPRILRVGRSVYAIGAVVPSNLARSAFGVPPSELVDRIVPLEDLWPREDVECLGRSVAALRDRLLQRLAGGTASESIGRMAARTMNRHAGRVSIDRMARTYGLSRREFGRRFQTAAGLPPKLFARITRFQALVRSLLSTDVAEWTSLSSAVGFYDQAHMINEFRAFTGSSPTVFFRPHGGEIESAKIQMRGRPSEWLGPVDPP